MPDLLRLARNRSQAAVSKARAHLPPELGGRFSSEDVEARLIDRQAANAFRLGSMRAAEEIRKAAREEEQPEGEFHVGLYLEGRLVAVGSASKMWKSLGDQGPWFGGDRVLPELRGRGLGRVLHGKRLDELRSRGTEGSVRVHVNEKNKRSLASLGAAGFAPSRDGDLARRITDEMISRGASPGSRYIVVEREIG
ncbi:MAG: GNAT family N-acetyltransferase [Polyangia bacterium]